LHAYLTLPSTLFPDKYQLSNGNPILLSSLNLRSIHSIAGYTDLEAPEYASPAWGSSMLVELAPPSSSNTGKAGESQWQATIPLHLRYLVPTNETSGLSQIEIPWPVVFWACQSDESNPRMSTNPFDRVQIGYEGLFGDGTIFYHLQPRPVDHTESLVYALDVPVLNAGWFGMRSGLVEIGTGFVVLAGWIWVVWCLWYGWASSGARKNNKKKDL
jgi:hypothetical protein